MPTQTFELHLTDTTRTTRLVLLLLLGVFAMAGTIIGAAVYIDNKVLMLLLVAALVGGGGYLGFRAYKRAALVPAIITITPAQLRIEDLRPAPRLSHTLRLVDITTYRCSSYNGTEELRLNLPGAPPLKLRSSGALARAGDFRAMLVAFEQAMGEAPIPIGSPTGLATARPTGAPTRRERSFFEKPISTYLLVPFTLVIGAVAVGIFTNRRALGSSMIGVLGTYLAYVAAWRAAAPRRNAS